MNNGTLPPTLVEPGEPAPTPITPSPHPEPSTLDAVLPPHPPSSTLHPLPSPQPSFPLCPGETPRAFAAFMAYFQLGHTRSLLAVSNQLSENYKTVQKWSCKFQWAGRINAFNSGLLEQQAQAEAEIRRKEAADWARRSNAFREQEWAATQKLLAAAQCFLETYGDREVAHMSLGQVSRTVQIALSLGRQTLAGAMNTQEPFVTPLQAELTAALQRAYGQPLPAPSLNSQPSTLNALHQ